MAVAFVQSNKASGSSATPSATYSSTPTSGNLLVAAITVAGGTAITMSNAGWTSLTDIHSGGGVATSIHLFYKIAGGGEPTTITGAGSTAAWSIIISEYSGVDTTTPLNIDNAQTNTANTVQTTPTVTPTGGGDILALCFSGIKVAGTWSTEQVNASATGVNVRDSTSTTGMSAVLYDKLISSESGTFVGTATSSGSSSRGSGAIAVFNAAAGSGGTSASITQLAANVTASGGTQTVVSVSSSAITQVHGTITATGGTQSVAGSGPTTYYVKTGGNDTLDGKSPTNAWASITKVNAVTFNPGDIIQFNGGDTFTGKIFITESGSSGSPITFQSYGTGNATISNSGDDALFCSNAAFITIQNLNFTGTGGNAGIDFFCDSSSPATRLDGIIITNVDVTGFNSGISIGSSTANFGYSNVSVTNSNLHGNRDYGLVTFGPTYNVATPYYAISGMTVTSVNCYSNLGNVSNTTSASGFGAVLGSVTTGTVSSCEFYSNGSANGDTTSGPAGCMVYNSTGVVVKNSVAYSNTSGTVADGDGFDLDIHTLNSTVEYCMAYNNGGSGILCFGDTDNVWSGNTIRYNLTWGNARITGGGTYHGEITSGNPTKNSAIYNNTLVARDTGSTQPSPIRIHATPTGITVRNNILLANSGPNVLTDTSISWTTSNIIFQGNDYFRASGLQITWNGTTYTTLAAWRAAISGQEVVSAVNTGITTDPSLVNATTSPTETDPTVLTGARTLMPLSGSGVLGTGLDLNTDFGTVIGSQDFFGNSLASPYNIGGVQGSVAPVTQAAGTITAAGGTQSIAAVRNVAITQAAATVTATGGTQSIATRNIVAVTQVHATVTATGGTQVVTGTNTASISQVAGTVTAAGGTQSVAAVVVASASISQVAANVTASGGTQTIAAHISVSITQSAATITASGGTQTVASTSFVAISQLAGTVTATGGTQSVIAGHVAVIGQIATSVTASGGTQSVSTVRKVAITQIHGTLTATGGTQSVAAGAKVNATVAQVAGSITGAGGIQSVSATVVISANIVQSAATITVNSGQVLLSIFIEVGEPLLIQDRQDSPLVIDVQDTPLISGVNDTVNIQDVIDSLLIKDGADGALTTSFSDQLVITGVEDVITVR